MVVSVINEFVFDMLLIVFTLILLVTFIVSIIFEERKGLKKRTFFKYNIYYDVDHSLYVDMVKKMKRVIFKKKLELFWFSLLVFLRRIFVWSKN